MNADALSRLQGTTQMNEEDVTGFTEKSNSDNGYSTAITDEHD